MSSVYYPGYYLSNLHLNNVMSDLRDCISPVDRRCVPVTNDSKKLFPEELDIESQEFKEKTSYEHLQSLLNLYKPMSPPPLLSSLQLYRDSLDENTRIHLEDANYARSEQDVKRYASPARGIPQTYFDRNLNERLIGLIEKELAYAPPYNTKGLNLKFKDSDSLPYYPYYPLYDEYLYPYLYNGYLYPYTKWLLYRRELERTQRRLRESRSAARAETTKKRESSLPRSVRFNPVVEEKQEAPPPAPEKKAPQPSRPAPSSLLVSDPAYDYRQRPWEYMSKLRQEARLRALCS